MAMGAYPGAHEGKCMDTSKILFDYGTVQSSHVGIDVLNPIKMRITVVLDHEVDGEFLKQAWDRTKRVYPLIESVLRTSEGADMGRFLDPAYSRAHLGDRLYLVQAEGGSNDPVMSKVPVTPGCDLVGNRLLSVTYCGRQISLCAYHLLVDGQGMTSILRTLVYAYLALHTGHEDENPVVELRENRRPEEYYQVKTNEILRSMEYAPVPIYTLPLGCRGYLDEDMRNEGNDVLSGTLAMDAGEFLRLCKSNGANPSAMSCALLARAAYALGPAETRDLVFGITTSQRNELGINDSIANVVGYAFTYATRAEVEGLSLAEVSQRLRKDIGMQRGRDYVGTISRVNDTYGANVRSIRRTVTYMGTFSVGSNDVHIVDYWIDNNGRSNYYLVEANGVFYMTLLYGTATQRYLAELARSLEELGVHAELRHPAHVIPLGSSTAVL